jgi:hypothetical protein
MQRIRIYSPTANWRSISRKYAVERERSGNLGSNWKAVIACLISTPYPKDSRDERERKEK